MWKITNVARNHDPILNVLYNKKLVEQKTTSSLALPERGK